MIRGTRAVLELLAAKWSVDILYLLASGTRRYSEVLYEVGEISKKTLTQTLRSLEHAGSSPAACARDAGARRVLADAARLEPHRAADGDVRVGRAAPRRVSPPNLTPGVPMHRFLSFVSPAPSRSA